MSLTIKSTDGLNLEAELDGPEDATKGLVLCHPHPKMGGTMNAPLLLALRDGLVGLGWKVLRFNFRGIGASEGESTTGQAEIADAEGALHHLAKEITGSLALAGWSFGGAVAVRTAARNPQLVACVAIAPSVKPRPDITIGLPGATSLKLDMPLLVVCGANDDVIVLDDCRSWSEEVSGATCVAVPGANHFFWAKYDDLTKTIADFLDEHA
jgi:uncharacterized protein